MTTNLPPITHADIQRWAGPASFQKGMAYFSRGAIFDPRRQGQTLKARCRGSQAASYQLQATLGPTGIASADCSCPVGAGGRCKHVAALLLTWLDNPDSFQEIEALTAALEKRSKAELIALIRRMIQREPELEILLEMPLPGVETGEKPLDPQVIRRQAEHAFRSPHGDWEMGWGDPYEIVEELQSLFDLAKQYEAQNNSVNAATIYRMVAETVLDNEDAVVQDEDGRLGGVVDDCAEGLGECLESITDAAQRESMLKALFDIYAWDVKMGGIGVGDSAPGILLERATPQERQMISDWIETALDEAGDWGRRAMGGLLLKLQADTMDDESFLEICRQTGRLKDLVERLLSLGRVDEAAGESRQAGDYDLLSLADLFEQHGHGRVAQTLIREQATSQDTRLTEWLKDYAKRQGNLLEALELAEKLFWLRPSVPAYAEIRRLATPRKQWPDLRAKTLASLADKGQYNLLTEIYLEESEIDRALESLERAKASSRYWGGFSLQVEVAEAASEKRPKEAIRLYMQLVESLIGQRGRESYAQAAAYLQQVRDLYRRLGESQTWQALIANIREQHRNLPALRDELNRAGL
ncbi:MAG: SWIM zinc finger family protein [Anaerolineales bacterium]|nr:SWIM zinc finger family protein [Anaerolineales bacterium]